MMILFWKLKFNCGTNPLFSATYDVTACFQVILCWEFIFGFGVWWITNWRFWNLISFLEYFTDLETMILISVLKNLIETMEIYCLMMNKIVFLKTIYPSGKLIIITCFSEVYSVVMCYLRLISLFLIVNWFLVSGKLNVSAPQVLTVLCVESCVIRVGCV